MRPVTLGRVVETAFLAEKKHQISFQSLEDALGVSENRSKEILREMVEMGLIVQEDDQFTETEMTKKFVHAIRRDEWREIHQIMMGYPYYAIFYRAIQKYGPIELNEIVDLISDEDRTFNAATISVISDWSERIGSLQKNVFNNHYYAVDGTDELFTPALLNVYDELNRSGIGNLKQRYVEIPKIREQVCEKLKIRRKKFDKKFLDLYVNNIGRLELSGAPITTHAKKSNKKIKSAIFLEMSDRITMELTSDRYLNGVEYRRKQYYYLAIHKRDLS